MADDEPLDDDEDDLDADGADEDVPDADVDDNDDLEADDDVFDEDDENEDEDEDEDEAPSGDDDDDFAGLDDDDFAGLDDDDFDDDDDEGGSSGKKKLIIIGASAIVLITALAGGTLMLLGGGEDQEQAAAGDSAIPVVSMAIPPKRRMTVTDESKPRAPMRAAPQGTETSRSPKPALTPPPATAGQGAKPATAGQGAKPATAAKPVSKIAAARPGPAATGVRRAPGKGVITPSVTAVAYRGIPIQPRGKPLRGINSALVESTASGLLPRMSPGGGAAWQEYARPFPKDNKRARVAVIIRGIGLGRASTLAAINQLPAAFTLAFSPYTNNLENWMGMARSAGHETLIDLPMEPNDFPVSDPGPLAMLTDLEDAQNIGRLKRLLGLAPGYVGVIQVMGSKFAASEASLTPVLSEVQKRGLLYVDGGEIRNGLAVKVVRSMALPWTSVTLSIDGIASGAAINARLADLENRARKDKSAVGLAQPYPVTVRSLVEWVKSLEFKELVLAPVSAVVRVDGPPPDQAGADQAGDDKAPENKAEDKDGSKAEKKAEKK
ncbi:MAG: divergent polysaccharide deacetylase family protein [Rhodospirillales bacterium]|jgi:hypothetical protein|nr:hypothetical protein [Rhodospirillaceae bacterium]MDP6427857.1 divergent polysaccharide deacetylase family protein [Rhodospirillales bacterium]MDP6642806.1 divergent polysaccharide deacetylase family protein [Rhodospirillales bacterium]MDP6840747.1 divergent polysaccharide deacetylase family protein [Rhodospirillales bacterium]